MKKQFKSQNSFLDRYRNEIAPKIKSIDIILKSENEISIKALAEITEVKPTEINDILLKYNYSRIDKNNVAKIMIEIKSDVCQMLKREIECGSPELYSADEISYIYKIEKAKVEDAFAFMECDRISGKNLSAVFAQIML